MLTRDVVRAILLSRYVSLSDRIALTRELARVVKPGGIVAVIEHNPSNPVTKLIVSRCPVDQEARLLSARQTKAVLLRVELVAEEVSYFLFFPEGMYRKGGAGVERRLSKLPLGGQYAVFSRKKAG